MKMSSTKQRKSIKSPQSNFFRPKPEILPIATIAGGGFTDYVIVFRSRMSLPFHVT
jgi:hypothetical protein